MNSKDWRPTAFVETAPGVDDEEDASDLERQRQSLALLRHVLTLCTFALLLTVTLVDKAFASAQRRDAVAIAVGAFLLGLVLAGVAHLALLAGARPAWTAGRARLAWTAATFAAFAVGTAALAWFFFANWRR